MVSLNAGDTLLYPGYTTGLLQAVVTRIDDFGKLSGFSINWDKSVLMPLDPLLCPLPGCAWVVEVVKKFRYLGVQISPDPTEYICLNLLPILTKFREKCSLLPLSVAGRINLVKMVWAPSFFRSLITR